MHNLDLANPTDWNQYIGSMWETVFRTFNVPKNGVIVEIAPGDANKVGLGLRNYGFTGHLYVIEPNGKTLAQVSAQYLQDFDEITLLKKTLSDSIAHLPSKVDAVIANHPLDDMIIGMARDDKESQDFYDTHYGNDQGKMTLGYWTALEANPSFLSEIKHHLINEWRALFAAAKPDLVAISQYESYFFRSNNIQAPDKHALDLLEMMARKFENEPVLESEQDELRKSLQYERWLFLKKP